MFALPQEVTLLAETWPLFLTVFNKVNTSFKKVWFGLILPNFEGAKLFCRQEKHIYLKKHIIHVTVCEPGYLYQSAGTPPLLLTVYFGSSLLFALCLSLLFLSTQTAQSASQVLGPCYATCLASISQHAAWLCNFVNVQFFCTNCT